MKVITQALGEQIYTVLKERITILSRTFGTRIDLEQLAKEFGVSQTPVREALHRLSRDGLVEIIPRQGYYVASPSIEDINDIYDLRKLLEGYALECAMKGNSDVQPLHKLKGEMKAALRETNRQVKTRRHDVTDHKLHFWIIQNCTNTKLYELYLYLGNFIRISHSLDLDLDNSLKEHIELIETILSGDTETAKDALVKHIENARRKGIRGLKALSSPSSIPRRRTRELANVAGKEKKMSLKSY